MMAQTPMALINKQDFNCPICRDLVEDPIAIPCGHSYCRRCIWEHRERNTDLETVSCPQCRQSFSPMPVLGRNILLAETVETVAASPVPMTSPTAANVQEPGTSATTVTNIQQPPTSVSVSNVQEPHTSTSMVTYAQIETPVRRRRFLALLCICVAFSVALYGAQVTEEQLGKWCIFCWGFCFTGTALVLLVEQCGLQSRVPISLENFTITFACLAWLLCLFGFMLLFSIFIYGQNPYRMAAAICSFVASKVYRMEGWILRLAVSDSYMATKPGLLKVGETVFAGFIFLFISNPVSYESHAAFKWCMAVYCVCFILSSMIIIACIRNGSACLSNTSSFVLLPFYALMATIMYLTATIIWPIYNFDEQHGGSFRSAIVLDERIVVAVLTGVNFILYLADLIFSITRLV